MKEKKSTTSGPIKEGVMKGNIRRITATSLRAAPPKPIKKKK